MKNLLLCQILVFSFFVSAYSQNSRNEKFIGVFQSCVYHCSTYYIYPDFTFRHKFINETVGNWKYIGKNKIKLYAPGKKAVTAFLPVEKENGEIVKIKLKIPKVPAFRRVLIFENDSFCIIYNHGKSKTCYQRIEADPQGN